MTDTDYNTVYEIKYEKHKPSTPQNQTTTSNFKRHTPYNLIVQQYAIIRLYGLCLSLSTIDTTHYTIRRKTNTKCRRQDLNLYTLRYQNLNLTCLPFSPRLHIIDMTFTQQGNGLTRRNKSHIHQNNYQICTNICTMYRISYAKLSYMTACFSAISHTLTIERRKKEKKLI